ncbi:MAG: DUF2974 domain-containing protein [Oscillibacter sp.]|nr:DUF2974 domain-containing protein [Oscillibacter sp.]
MANLFDYLDWRGDLTLAQAPFNEVDNLILAELSFVDFRGIVPEPGASGAVSLREAAEQVFARVPAGAAIDMGVLVPDTIPLLLKKTAASRRFRDMRLSCYVDWLDTEQAVQFSALTIETGDGLYYIAFRGTDDTLAGWKEDFHMACMEEVPAQRMAVEYTRAVARQYPRRRLRLGGHSKGGNLAVYSAALVPPVTQRRIQSVWSNDGPGFHRRILDSAEYARIAERVVSIVPKSSVVGMLLEHDEDYIVVDSVEQGLLQHDGFSWSVLGDHFIRLDDVTRQSRMNDRALKEWVRSMPLDQREKFVEGLFEVLSASGAVTLTDLKEESLKAAGAMIRAMKDMEKDTRDAVLYALKVLIRSNAKVLREELQQEMEKLPKKLNRTKKEETNS